MITRRLPIHSIRPKVLLRPISKPFARARYASTAPSGSSSRSALNLLYGSVGTAFVLFSYIYVTDTRASIHRYVVPPLIRYIYPDAEDAHQATVSSLVELFSLGLHPRERGSAPTTLAKVGEHVLWNEIGISGGLDKYADIPDALFALGPSIVEIGGVTPLPQQGNPRPRVFRIASEEAIVNRYGLPSEGADAMALRLRQRLREFAYALGYGAGDEAEERVLNGEAGVPVGSLSQGRLLAVQIAKNKDTSDDIDAVVADHVYCAERLSKYADILVVNVSSPNTPGLRALQARESLTKILSAVVKTSQATSRAVKPIVMVKVSPDEDSQAQIQGIVDAVYASGVDGVIVGNTTKLRPEEALTAQLSDEEAVALREQGGYSGPQLFDRTLALVKSYRTSLDSALKDESDKTSKILFASGGITNGNQARQVLSAGASIAMVYTAMTYSGAGTITRIKDELALSRLKGNK